MILVDLSDRNQGDNYDKQTIITRVLTGAIGAVLNIYSCLHSGGCGILAGGCFPMFRKSLHLVHTVTFQKSYLFMNLTLQAHVQCAVYAISIIFHRYLIFPALFEQKDQIICLQNYSMSNKNHLVVRPSSRRWPSNHPIGGCAGGWSDQSEHGKFLYIWGRGWWQGMSTYLHLISSPAVFSPLWWFSLSREFLRHCAGEHATHWDFVLQAPRCQGLGWKTWGILSKCLCSTF